MSMYERYSYFWAGIKDVGNIPVDYLYVTHPIRDIIVSDTVHIGCVAYYAYNTSLIPVPPIHCLIEKIIDLYKIGRPV